jgi:hypothetical protein
MPEPTLKSENEDDEEQQANDADGEVEDDTPAEEVDGENSESEVDADADDEDVDLEDADLPEDVDDDEDDASSGLLAGSTIGIPNKVLLGVGIAAVVVVLWLRTADRTSTERDYDDDQVEEEIDDGSDGQRETEQTALDAGASGRKYTEQSQQAAIENVFGG